jgi:hypothetical protein
MATIRPATESELPAMAALDFDANIDHPSVTIPWAKPSDASYLFLNRYQSMFKQPHHHFDVAVLNDEIVGLIIYDEYVVPGTVEEWKPIWPENAKADFFEYIIAQSKNAESAFDNTGYYSGQLI